MTTREVSKSSGLSESRCLQFARKNGVQRIQLCEGVSCYYWTVLDLEALMMRKGNIGKHGKRLEKSVGDTEESSSLDGS